MTEQNDIMNATEAAEFIKIHYRTLLRMAKKGEIPAVKTGKDWKFSRKALQDFFYKKANENVK